MDFLLLNPVFNFHTTLYRRHIVNFIFFTVYLPAPFTGCDAKCY